MNFQGELLQEKNQNQDAVKAYTEAFKIIQSNSTGSNSFKQNTQIFRTTTVESVHRELIDLLSTKNTKENSLLNQVRESLINYYYAELEYLLKEKKWQTADEKTWLLILHIAKKEKEGSLDEKSISHFPCRDLQKIDQLWVKNSGGRFGFSVQKRIYDEIVKEEGGNSKIVQLFGKKTGWFSSNLEFNQFTLLGLNSGIDLSEITKGYLPFGVYSNFYKNLRESMLSRLKPHQKNFYQYRSLEQVIDFTSTHGSESDSKYSWDFAIKLVLSSLTQSCPL